MLEHRSALAYLAAAAATRNLLRTTQSRVQICGFAALAGIIEIAKTPSRGRPSTRQWLCNASGAAAGIIAVKFVLEGIPMIDETLKKAVANAPRPA